MSRSLEERGQTSFETIIIAGGIVAVCALIGSYYFGAVADQTTAVIILKTELLKELNKLGKTYTIVSSLEPTFDPATGELLFDVVTSPETTGNDDAALRASCDPIKQKIAAKTKYNDPGKIIINLNSGGAC